MNPTPAVFALFFPVIFCVYICYAWFLLFFVFWEPFFFLHIFLYRIILLSIWNLFVLFSIPVLSAVLVFVCFLC
ncbi:hypothetical protein BC829DRAFT_388161, partial [Chytridium lagenaria]